MRATPKVLIAESREERRAALAAALERYGFRVSTTGRADEALKLARTGEYQCVVADFDLPGTECHQMVAAIRADSPKTQVIVVDAESDTRTYLEVMEEGAFDYFPPDAQPSELVRQIRHAVGLAKG